MAKLSEKLLVTSTIVFLMAVIITGNVLVMIDYFPALSVWQNYTHASVDTVSASIVLLLLAPVLRDYWR